jgi:hypothetical protein
VTMAPIPSALTARHEAGWAGNGACLLSSNAER